MARILLQTTIPYAPDDWHVGRFSLLRAELVAAGHDVTARNREPDAAGNDPVLSGLATSAFDQLWLMGVDTGDGLCGAPFFTDQATWVSVTSPWPSGRIASKVGES